MNILEAMNKIAFIGGGHIAQALAQGLIMGGIDPSTITVTNPTLGKLARFSKKTKAHTTTDNRNAVQNADIVFITVQPDIVKQVIDEIKESISSGMIIISVAACVDFALLSRYFGKRMKVKLVRILPNIPVEERKGVVGITYNSQVTAKDRKKVTKLLQRLGLVIECKSEKMREKLGLISGCGPGVVGYLIEAMKKEAQRFGFTPQESESIAIKTFEGTIAHLKAAKINPNQLVAAVATPGGITEKIIQTLSSGYPQLLRKSLMRGYDRITNITKELKEST